MKAALSLAIALLAIASPGAESYRFAEPTRLAIASCTDFPWVSDLALCEGTTELLARSATRVFGLEKDRVETWSNGSSAEFQDWMGELAKKGEPEGTLILYLVSHQLKDGSVKFSKGADITASQLVTAVNTAARNYSNVLLINDGCHGAALERGGRLLDNVTRLYASAEDEDACHVSFEHGPYGLAKFSKDARAAMKRGLGFDPEGMSLMGLLGAKAALVLGESPGATVTLQDLFRGMAAGRDDYDRQVRQARVQHLVLVPATANFDLLRRVEP